MRLRRRLRLGAYAVLGGLTAFVAVTLATTRFGDASLFPARNGNTVRVYLVSHGYHSGLVIPREAMNAHAQAHGLIALREIAKRFGAYESLEIGWGDEGFYRHVPTVASLTWKLALRALFSRGNPSVLHVVGLPDTVRKTFPFSDVIALDLSPEGFMRLLDKLDATFATDLVGLPVSLGQGLYGPSLFYRALGEFNIFNVCNHWTARLLDAAGVPTSPIIATLPFGLLLDLNVRSGVGVISGR